MHANITRLKVNDKVIESLGLTSASLLGLSLGWKQMKPAVLRDINAFVEEPCCIYFRCYLGFFSEFHFVYILRQ